MLYINVLRWYIGPSDRVLFLTVIILCYCYAQLTKILNLIIYYWTIFQEYYLNNTSCNKSCLKRIYMKQNPSFKVMFLYLNPKKNNTKKKIRASLTHTFYVSMFPYFKLMIFTLNSHTVWQDKTDQVTENWYEITTFTSLFV